MSDTPRDQEPDPAAPDRAPGPIGPEPASERIEPITAPPADTGAGASDASKRICAGTGPQVRDEGEP